jgi:hypothetical protein
MRYTIQGVVMQVTRRSALILAALFLTIVSTVAGFVVSPGGYLSPLASPSLLGPSSGITGSITIGPVYPVCSALKSTTPAPSYYNQIQVLVTPSSGLSLTVPVKWVLVSYCWVGGTFKIALNPGAYSLTITSCTKVNALMIPQPIGYGCQDLPRTFMVESGAWTRVDISIRTGIE